MERASPPNDDKGPSGGAFSDLIKSELRHQGLSAERRLVEKLGEQNFLNLISGAKPTRRQLVLIAECLDLSLESLAEAASIRDAMVDRAMSELWVAIHDMPDAASKRRAAIMIEDFAERLKEAVSEGASVRTAIGALRIVGRVADGQED